MKALEEKIIEILNKHEGKRIGSDVFAIHHANYESIALEIETFIAENFVPKDNLEMQKNQIERDKYLCGFYPKQFIEWLIYKSIYVTPHNITLHKFWNGTINEYQVVFRENTGCVWEDRTLDQIFDYWLNNIKK